MSPVLIKIGGVLVAAATAGVGIYAAVVWWRRDKFTLADTHPGRDWPVLWVLGIVLLSRIWALGVGSAGALALLKAEWPDLTFLDLWNRWDAPHYLDVARDGYQIVGDPRYFIVFYPLYPWLVRGAAAVFGQVFWAGIVVSNTCLALACVLLYRLFRLDMDGDSAGWAIVFLCFSPLSFFFSIPYTESLYLLLTVAFFYAARRGRWLWAGIAGFLAALSRNFGILLLVPLLVLGIEKWQRREKRGWWGWALCFVLIPAGLFTYLLVNKVVTGDWWTFMVYQREHWSNVFGFFGVNVLNQLACIFSWPWEMVITVFLPNLAAFLFCLGLLAYGARRMPGAYLAYGLVYLIVAYSPTWLLSGGRYMMVMFPLWGMMALGVKNTKNRFAVLVAFELLLGLYSLLFAMGRTVL